MSSKEMFKEGLFFIMFFIFFHWPDTHAMNVTFLAQIQYGQSLKRHPPASSMPQLPLRGTSCIAYVPRTEGTTDLGLVGSVPSSKDEDDDDNENENDEKDEEGIEVDKPEVVKAAEPAVLEVAV
eukprot:CAMPEP_0206587248 /NCGR_PEP_ID=MMETSP0325_2-20121206/37534_1 /ASSEMBLY_ACC=CAM_ASM_000347 /TAXON_ID=2866 /ORGANISM="Crypthecodinium cohnii, Strain Seligo" /LENGTH=123 /DNA_ID=CAMNT_0054095219 /DNA_START=401 /DNA_END=767 /DNA_ORIENTATION=-